MSEMVERVAKAIAARSQSLTTLELSKKWELFACAAIEAMREPTEAMVLATTLRERGAWQAMINAVLSHPLAEGEASEVVTDR